MYATVFFSNLHKMATAGAALLKHKADSALILHILGHSSMLVKGRSSTKPGIPDMACLGTLLSPLLPCLAPPTY
jgi:hypothetical protein